MNTSNPLNAVDALQALAKLLKQCFDNQRPLEVLGILDVARRESPIKEYLTSRPADNRYASIPIDDILSWGDVDWLMQLKTNYRLTMNVVAQYCTRRGQFISDLALCENHAQGPLDIAYAFEEVVIPALDFLALPREQLMTLFRAKNLLSAANQDDSPQAWHPGWVLITNQIDGISIKHHQLAFGSLSHKRLSPTAAQKATVQEIKIGVVEYLDPYPVHIPGIHPKDGVESRWNSVGLVNDDQMIAATEAVVNSAIQSGMHLLLLPELSGSEKQLNAIRQILRNEPDKLGNSLALVQCPSFHRSETKNRTVNVTHLLDANGNTLLAHEKINPVSLNSPDGLISEAISRGECINLLHTPIGIICPLICHDLSQQLADTTLVNILQRLPIDILLVCSLSEHVDPHVRSAKEVGLTHNIAAIIANQAWVAFADNISYRWREKQSGGWHSGKPEIFKGSDGQKLSLNITLFTPDGKNSSSEVKVTSTVLEIEKISLSLSL